MRPKRSLYMMPLDRLQATKPAKGHLFEGDVLAPPAKADTQVIRVGISSVKPMRPGGRHYE